MLLLFVVVVVVCCGCCCCYKLETIKREQVEQKSVLKFPYKAPCEKTQHAFSVRKSTKVVLCIKLNKFPVQKGTVNDDERHPFLVTIEKEKVLPRRSQR